MQSSALVTAMARLLLQQEDALNGLSLETEFMVFMQLKTEGSQLAARCPLRMMMSTCLFKELEDRSSKLMAATVSGDAVRKELIKTKLITEDGLHWNQLMWNAEAEQLQPTDGPRLSLQQAHPGASSSCPTTRASVTVPCLESHC